MFATKVKRLPRRVLFALLLLSATQWNCLQTACPDELSPTGRGTILKSDGASWTPQASGTKWLLWDVWGTDASNVWAAGLGKVQKWEGTSWVAQPTSGQAFNSNVWAADVNHAWVVGGDGILTWNGVSWMVEADRKITNPLAGVWGVDATN